MNWPTMNERKVPFNPKTGEGIAFPTGGKPHKKVGIHPLPQIANTKPLPKQYTRDDSKSTRPTNSKMRHIMPNDRAPDFSTKPEQKKRSYMPNVTIKKNDNPRGFISRGNPKNSFDPYEKDSLGENIAEAVIPGYGSLISLDDIQRAAYRTRHKSAREKLKEVVPEVFGALPAGKFATKGLNMVADTAQEIGVRYGTQAINAIDTAGDIYHDNVKPAFQKLMNMGK